MEAFCLLLCGKLFQSETWCNHGKGYFHLRVSLVLGINNSLEALTRRCVSITDDLRQNWAKSWTRFMGDLQSSSKFSFTLAGANVISLILGGVTSSWPWLNQFCEIIVKYVS